MRKIYYWKLRETELQLGERTLLMGVLNVTPDSFSDGGRFSNPDRAYARALEMEEEGADIIDIGAESTKPGSQRISSDEEWQRLVPVLKRLRGNLRVPLSLDSYKSETAERALDYGVQIFNDPSGLTFDPHLAKVASNANVGLILNHMRGLPESWPKLPPMQDPVGTIMRELEATISRARHSGVERNRIVIDPGLGFGKRKEQNSEILARLQQLTGLDLPILVGPSRKSFLAQPTENETLFATAAAVTISVINGAHIIRVHDVKEMRAVVLVAEEVARVMSARQAPVIEERRPPRPPRPALAVPAPAPAPPPEPAKREDGGWRPPARRDNARTDRGEERRDRGGPARFQPGGPKRPFRREDGDRPPRREFKPRGDFKPKGEFKPKGDFKPRGEFKPKGEFKPRGEFKPKGEFKPRGEFKPKGFKGPKRPFRKRP